MSAGIEQLKFLSLILTKKYSFQYDLEEKKSITIQALPSFSLIWRNRNFSYSKLRYVFLKYLRFNGSKRATVNEVMYYLNGYFDIAVLNLEVSQVKT